MKSTVEAAVLALIAERPRLAREVRDELAKRGFAESAVRGAIARLWDTGRLNVGIDQLLHPIPESKDAMRTPGKRCACGCEWWCYWPHETIDQARCVVCDDPWPFEREASE